MSHVKHFFSITHLTAGFALSVAVATAFAPAVGEGRPVVLDGRVQWIAAKTMMVLPDSGGLPVNIDLTKVPQDNYTGLTQGHPVVVNGSYDGHRVLATSVTSAARSSRQ